MRCLALDIGGTKIASAIVTDGKIEQRQQIATPQADAANEMRCMTHWPTFLLCMPDNSITLQWPQPASLIMVC